MRTKAERAERKAKKVEGFMGVFRRAYEMKRAYGASHHKAFWDAYEEAEASINAEINKSSFDKSFLVDCKIEFKDKVRELRIEVACA